MPALGRRIPVPLIGPSSQGRSLTQNPERTINLYPEASTRNAKAPVALLHTPGRALAGDEYTRSGASVATSTLDFSPVRGWHVMDGRFFLVEGSNLRERFEDDTSTVLATLPSIDGRVVITSNNGKLVIGDGGQFQVYDPVADTLTGVTKDGEEPLLGTWSAYIDQTTLYLERDTQRIWYSDVTEPATVDGDSLFSAELAPDNAVCLLVDRQEVYVIGTHSIQPFYDSGDEETYVFQKIGSGIVPMGTQSPFAVQPFDNAIVFIGSSGEGAGRVLRLNGPGAAPQRISTHAVEKTIEEALNAGGDPARITAFTYEEEGHAFYVVNVPGPNVNVDPGTSWAYDAATGEWHERAIFAVPDGQWHRDRAELHAYVFSNHYVADYKRGRVFTQSLDTLTQELHPNPRTRIFPMDTGGQKVTLDRLVFELTVGVGLDGGVTPSSDPQVMLKVSEDGGRTWGNEIWTDLGKIGATKTVVEFTRLGRSDNFVFELRIADEVVVQLNRAWATVRG